MSDSLSYKSSGVDIDVADATKRDMARSLETTDMRVLNKLGAFASLFDARFPGYSNPVLVLKTEEPGTKQKLAIEHGHYRSICYDMINHLINDIAVMGATPLSVQDAIICGKLEKKVVNELVDAVAQACRDQGCVLTGGETSEQPGVIPAGTYILTSSVVGVVEKLKIIDGSAIRKDDVVLAIASNGLHTNGYSLVRALIAKNPDIVNEMIADETFLEAILKPHLCYFQGLKEIFNNPGLHGLAHITGGGIGGNLNRIMPSGMSAVIDLKKIELLPLFRFIRDRASVAQADMLRTFNVGVGITAVCSRDSTSAIMSNLEAKGYHAYQIGVVCDGQEPVVFEGGLAA